MYPDNRQPRGQLADEVNSMLSVNGNPTLIANMVRQRGCNVTMKDIYNAKMRLRHSDSSKNSIEKLVQVLNVPGVHFSIVSDTEGQFICVYVQTEVQRQLLLQYGEVFQLDSTFKTDSMRFSLLTALVEDSDGMGQPVAFALMSSETEENISGFCSFLSDVNDLSGVKVVVVDKGLAEMNIVSACWPQTHLVLSYFHMLRTIDRHLLRTQLSAEDRKLCAEVIRSIIDSRSVDTFRANTQCLQETFPDEWQYFNSNWMPFKHSFCFLELKGLRTLNNRTNNRLERLHKTLKSTIGSSKQPVHSLVKSLLHVADVRRIDTDYRHFIHKTKVAANDGPLVDYRAMFSGYCCGIVMRELQKLKDQLYSVTEDSTGYSVYSFTSQTSYTVTHPALDCSCSLTVTLGVPCRHVFAVLQHRDESLFQPSLVAIRWKLPHLHYDADIQGLESSEIVEVEAEVVPVGSQCQESSELVVSEIEVVPKSRSEKLASISVLTKQLASYVADQPSSDFEVYRNCLSLLVSHFKAGNVSAVLHSLENCSNNDGTETEFVDDNLCSTAITVYQRTC